MDLSLLSLLAFAALTTGIAASGAAPGAAPVGAADAGAALSQPVIPADVVKKTVDALVAAHGAEARERASTGVEQAARFWRQEDGSAEAFALFCQEHFVAAPDALKALLDRFDRNFEALIGHRVAMTRTLREPSDLEMGPRMPVDGLFGSLDPFDHLIDDLFATQVAFAALLNFPLLPLDTLVQQGKQFARDQWAAARLTKAVSMRIPGNVRQLETKAFRESDDYIVAYNIAMGCLVDGQGNKPFPRDMKLISHWGLRDEIRALYSDPKGNLPKQQLIFEVMLRIIRQQIPATVINDCTLDWNPLTNKVAPHKEGTRDDLATFAEAPRENDRRYEELLRIFHAQQQIDRWSPAFPTYIDRKFKLEREIPEERVAQLLTDVVSSPMAAKVAKVIKTRLGRELQPFDLWYDGFKNRSLVAAEDLDKDVTAKYPDAKAFQAAIPGILGKLGFPEGLARTIADHIIVDSARGAGHAMGAGMRADSAHLRTRIGPNGMDYKGYNIAAHELGHNVEQVLSLNHVDRVLMAGVPNTAFTEAFAFLFQARDLELLGRGAAGTDPVEKANRILDLYWSTFEISGVALLDMRVWRYMYAHPDVTPAQLREAVVAMATEIWNTYYAPVFGIKDSPILAIYSHMIDAGLYLPDYPIGFLVSYQIEAFLEGKQLGEEMPRMCAQGTLTPDLWMVGAVGAPLSAKPLLDAVKKAVAAVK